MALANQDSCLPILGKISIGRCALALAAIVIVVATSLMAFGARQAHAAGPYDCTDPYYYSTTCTVDGAGSPAVSAVSFKLAKRCRSRNFVLRPSYAGATVLSSKLYLNNRKYVFRTAAPFAFRVNVKRLTKGKTYKMRLATVFTSGEAVSLKFNVKRCGKPFKRKRS